MNPESWAFLSHVKCFPSSPSNMTPSLSFCPFLFPQFLSFLLSPNSSLCFPRHNLSWAFHSFVFLHITPSPLPSLRHSATATWSWHRMWISCWTRPTSQTLKCVPRISLTSLQSTAASTSTLYWWEVGCYQGYSHSIVYMGSTGTRAWWSLVLAGM